MDAKTRKDLVKIHGEGFVEEMEKDVEHAVKNRDKGQPYATISCAKAILGLPGC